MKTFLNRKMMIALSYVLLIMATDAAALDNCNAVYGKGENRLYVAGGSPGELGLLKAVAETFNQKNDTTICWVKAGSGESLELLKQKKADVAIVHAPSSEKQAVMEGWAAYRTLVGSNEFYIVGPLNDPAKIASANSVADAYKLIAEAKELFLSRGDNSGTHKKELAIWKSSGITPGEDWYVETHDFMTATLKKANHLKGYFMTDNSTWAAEKKELPNLKVLFKGDPVLINTYHAMCRPDDASGNQTIAVRFIRFMASEQGQRIIRDYGKDLYGEPLYNDAEYAGKYIH